MKLQEIRSIAVAQQEHQAQPLHEAVVTKRATNELDQLTIGAAGSEKIARRESKNNTTVVDQALSLLPAMKVDGLGKPDKIRVSAQVGTDDQDSHAMAANRMLWSRHPRGIASSVLPWYVIGEKPDMKKPHRIEQLLVTPQASPESDYWYCIPYTEMGSGPSRKTDFGPHFAVASVDRAEYQALQGTDTQRLLAISEELHASDDNPPISRYSGNNIVAKPRWFHGSDPDRVAVLAISGDEVTIKGCVEQELSGSIDLTDELMAKFDVPYYLGRLVADFGKAYTI